MNMHATPVLLFEPRAWKKMLTYVQLSPVEINGWAYLRQLTPSCLYVADVDDVFITEQAVTAGSADNDGGTVAMALWHAGQAGRAEELKLQWHSHVNGTPVFSGTDTATMDRFGDAGATWMASVVMNKAGRATGRLDLYSPLRASVDLRLMLEQADDKELLETCIEDILAKVDKRTFTTIPARPGKPALRTYTDRPLEEKDLTIGDTIASHLPIQGA